MCFPAILDSIKGGGKEQREKNAQRNERPHMSTSQVVAACQAIHPVKSHLSRVVCSWHMCTCYQTSHLSTQQNWGLNELPSPPSFPSRYHIEESVYVFLFCKFLLKCLLSLLCSPFKPNTHYSPRKSSKYVWRLLVLLKLMVLPKWVMRHLEPSSKSAKNSTKLDIFLTTWLSVL